MTAVPILLLLMATNLKGLSDPRLITFRVVLTGFRQQARLQTEIIALRHQLTVLQRTPYPKRLLLNPTDRCFWVWLSRFWSGWRSALIIVKPETVIGWHRRGFQVVLDLEDSSRPTGTAEGSEGNS